MYLLIGGTGLETRSNGKIGVEELTDILSSMSLNTVLGNQLSIWEALSAQARSVISSLSKSMSKEEFVNLLDDSEEVVVDIYNVISDDKFQDKRAISLVIALTATLDFMLNKLED